MGGDTGALPTRINYPKLASAPVAKQIHHIYLDRIANFTANGPYASQYLPSKLYDGRASGSPWVRLSVWHAPNLSRPTFAEATSDSNHYYETQIGALMGPSWSTHWFRLQVKVPPDLRDKERLELHWDADNEGLVWTEHGEPLQGLTGGGERVGWVLPDGFRDGGEHTIYIEMACNRMFGNGEPSVNDPPNPNHYFTLHEADIVAVNLQARGLFFDFSEIGDAAREFPDNSWEEHEALQVCNAIIDHFTANHGNDKSVTECREMAQKYLGDKVDSSEVYDGPACMVTGIGNCHIDTCWLWPWAETKRKVARSWLNQVNLFDEYPEHRFFASQAQQFKWLKTYYPSAFDKVKQKVKEGKFHPIGGSWVEHDTNMPSGESMARQFLYGQRLYESYFGERCQTFWLPDTFGYSSQIPQLCRLAGMTRFFTQKLSWNNINEFPHTTFNWVGLDGSQVMCHMPPCNTYTAEADWGDVQRSVTQHKSMDQDNTSLLPFGKGDGGGGPTWQQLEKLRRCRGMSDTVGRLPRLKMGDTVDEFFSRLEKKQEHGTDFVTWYGELYLELHRGTYTTQANNKRNNRKAEILLHDIEYIAAYASIKDVTDGTTSGYRYPKKELDEMWENVLLCQFHDCLPGSAIEMCYEDSDKLYAKVFMTGEKLLEDALFALGFRQPDNGKGDLVAVNTMPFGRREMIRLPQLQDTPAYGALDGALGVSLIKPVTSDKENVAGSAAIEQVEANVYLLSNDNFNVTVRDGAITSIYDKESEFEVITPGARANQFVIFDDKPLFWQAWDVEMYHLKSRQELRPQHVTIAERGPQRVSLVLEIAVSDKSWIRNTISLAARNLHPRKGTRGEKSTWHMGTTATFPTFSTEVEWREAHKFLKVEFPTNIFNSTSASYETQHGVLHRPTHYNTSWDTAKFEVCAHKWADISDAKYGVSVLNDGKYGFACTANGMMRLSLLRAPKSPDGHADMKRHWIRYGVLPHRGPVGEKTVREARAFNDPISLGEPNGWGRRPDPGFVGEASPSDSCSDTSSISCPSIDSEEVALELDDDEPLFIPPPEATLPASGASSESALFPYTSLTSLVRRHAHPDRAAKLLSSVRMCPVCSDPNIILDAIKRGEDDEDVRHNANVPTLRSSEHVLLYMEDETPFEPVRAQTSGKGVREEVGIPIRKGSSIVIRLYESLGGRSKGRVLLDPCLSVKKVFKCNLLEDDEEEFEIEKSEGYVRASMKRHDMTEDKGDEEVVKGFKVDLRAFEVVSFRIELDGAVKEEALKTGE